MPLRSQIKLNAKLILKKSWLKASAVLVMIFLLCIGLSALEACFADVLGFQYPSAAQISTMSQLVEFEKSSVRLLLQLLPLTCIFSVLTFLLVTPLIMGMLEWYWRLTDNKPVGIGDVFSWFGSLRLYGKSLWMFLNIFLRLLPWVIGCVVLPYALALYGVFLLNGSNAFVELLSTVAMGSGLLLTLCGFFLLLYISSRYFAAPFLLAENHERKIGFCIRESAEVTKGQRGQVFLFNLSFLGWFLLLSCCMLLISVFAILPALYILPYYCSSCAVYAKYLIFSLRIRRRQAGLASGSPQNTMEFRA